MTINKLSESIFHYDVATDEHDPHVMIVNIDNDDIIHKLSGFYRIAFLCSIGEMHFQEFSNLFASKKSPLEIQDVYTHVLGEIGVLGVYENHQVSSIDLSVALKRTITGEIKIIDFKASEFELSSYNPILNAYALLS